LVLWIAGLSALVLMEKVLPHGQWLARAAGVGLAAAGAALLFQAV
jgi:predicted metal-binding membrane protein